MPPATSPWRHGLWVGGLVAVVWLACFRFPLVWTVTGVGEADRPFMDLHGILAACDAARARVDPFLPNNFDPYHRPHVYSTWWLELGRLGLGRPDTLWLGTTLVIAVLVAAVLVVRPRERHEGIALFLLLTSPALLLAVNRANNDLVVFLLVSVGLLCFRRETWPWQALGIVFFAVSAVLKYSPLTTLIVLLDLRSRRTLAAGLGVYAVVLALGAPSLVEGLQSAARFNPTPIGLFAYGAPALLRNFGLNSVPGWLLPGLLLVGWAGFLAGRRVAAPEPAGADRAAEREFMCGAALLVGLFFLGSSYVYKLVFALWLLPWLGRLRGSGEEGGWGRATWRLLLLVAWLEGGMAVLLNVLIARWSMPLARALLEVTPVAAQVATWALVACLLRFVLGYVFRRARALGVAG